MTINPGSNQTITIGQSIVYSSTANAAGGLSITRHDFDWQLSGSSWVSAQPNTSGTGTLEMGALTGTNSRSQTVSMARNNTRSLTMTPTQTGTYTVRFSAQANTGGMWHSSSHGIVVNPPPTGLTVSTAATASTWATITWTEPADVLSTSRYHILRDGVEVGTTNAATTTYTLTGLEPATTYTVVVQMQNAAGEVIHGSAPRVITTRLNNPVISDITTSGTTTSVTLTWEGSTGSGVTYKIERSTDGVNFAEIDAVTGALTYTDTTATTGATYYYRMRTDSDSDTSGYTSTVTTPPPPPSPASIPDKPPQGGLRLWLSGSVGVETGTTGQVVAWLDQSMSQAHAVLPENGTGPLVFNSSELDGHPVLVFDGQTNALELPPFMDNATAAIAYAIVKSGTTYNPLWLMGATEFGTLYPGESGRIEDDFGSTTVHVTQDSTPPLHQWHAYQVTSLNGSWWPSLNQEPLLTKTNPVVESLTWSNSGSPSTMSELTLSHSDLPLPALLPETGHFFEATVQAANPDLSNNYLGLHEIRVKLEDAPWLNYTLGANAGYIKKTPFVSGTARLTLRLDEVEALLNATLRDKQITGISLGLGSAVLNTDGTHAASEFSNNYDIKTKFAIAGTEVENQFSFAALPEIGGNFIGEIAEILIYDQSAAVDDSVNDYLSRKYNLFDALWNKDSDGDGIPDAWEIRNGLNPRDETDANKVADGDGTTYRQKYEASLLPDTTGTMRSQLIIREVDGDYLKVETDTWRISPISNL